MSQIEAILHAKTKPKEKQTRLVEAVVAGEIPVGELVTFF